MKTIINIFEETNKRKEKHTIHYTEDDFETWLKIQKGLCRKGE